EPFDLARGPLLRATLVVLADDRHRLLLTAHHAITDGWSSRCAFDELSAAYCAYAEGREPSLPDLPIQYADYADRQRERARHVAQRAAPVVELTLTLAAGQHVALPVRVVGV
ncbi:condensation domain-containing protein, partial [Burkholderia cenocepacia]|uniref:condensation domain-containing protein n=1 Tax=Burkholderia cenocepacia TaxID=95486 RepID=UPI0024B7FE70